MRSNQSHRSAGDAYEKYLAKLLGGQVVSGSGSGLVKGDVKVGKFLIQAKRTDGKSFSVKESNLNQAEREAMNQGRLPAFAIGFWKEDTVSSDWVAVPMWVFRMALAVLNENEEES